jgi:pimeloyl-ACP methyl ester carboxylesterase
MKEHAVVIPAHSPLIGVVTQPDSASARADAPVVVLLNSGLIHRVGPNRLYVSLARRLAGMGLTTLRFDLSAIGDSAQRRDTLPFQASSIEETRAALDHLQAQWGAKRFLLAGICTGAVVSFRTALQDPRVAGLCLINAQGLVSDASSEMREAIAERAGARYYTTSALRRKGSWARLLTGKADYKAIARAGAQRVKSALRPDDGPAAQPGSEEIVQGMARLLREQRPVQMLYSGTDPGLDELAVIYGGKGLEQLRRTPGLTYTLVPQADHMFTALSQQGVFLTRICDWVAQAS